MYSNQRRFPLQDPPMPTQAPPTAVPGTGDDWHARVEAHLTPTEITQYRLACSMLETIMEGSVRDAADWLPYAINTKDEMIARAITRMNLVAQECLSGGDAQ